MEVRVSAVLWDLDETLANTRELRELRDRGDWTACRKKISFVKPFDDIPEVFEATKKSCKVAVVTSSPRWYAETILKNIELIPDQLVAFRDTRRHKPDPEPYLKAATILGFEPDDCVVIGDNVMDYVASMAGNIRFIGVTWGETSEDGFQDAGADHIATTPFEILTLLGIDRRNQ